MITGPVWPPLSESDVDQLMHWLALVAWGSAALSILGVLAGLTMLAFGSRQAPRMIVGGIIGTIVAVTAATKLPILLAYPT
jgi:hypothetical protein